MKQDRAGAILNDEDRKVEPLSDLEEKILRLAKQPGGHVAKDLKASFSRRTGPLVQAAALRLFDDMFITIINGRICPFHEEDRVPMKILPLTDMTLHARELGKRQRGASQRIVVSKRNQIPAQKRFTLTLACGHTVQRRQSELPTKVARCFKCLPDEAHQKLKFRTDRWHRRVGDGPACTLCGAKVNATAVHRTLLATEINEYLRKSGTVFGPGYARKLKGDKLVWFK